ncbi:MAG: ribosome modulation factor [Alcanivoracaceae bacterium]|jgi:ribosome modulation factor|nr:ribosome modulation factor [Alcanivoracaceae bacterium]
MGQPEVSNNASEKAYYKGCMWAMAGRDSDQCPYPTEDDRASWWLAGWEEGHEAWQRRQQDSHPA